MKWDETLLLLLGDLFLKILEDKENLQQTLFEVLEEGEKDTDRDAREYYQRIMNLIDIDGFRRGAKKPLGIVVSKMSRDMKKNPSHLVDMVITWKGINRELWKEVIDFLEDTYTMGSFPFLETQENYELCEQITTAFLEENPGYEFYEVMMMTVLALLDEEEDDEIEGKTIDDEEEEIEEEEREVVDEAIHVAQKETVSEVLENHREDEDTIKEDKELEEVKEEEETEEEEEENEEKKDHRDICLKDILSIIEELPAKDSVWDEMEDFLSTVKEISKEKDREISSIKERIEKMISIFKKEEREIINFFMFTNIDKWKASDLLRQDVEEVEGDLKELMRLFKKYEEIHEKRPSTIAERRELSREKDMLEETTNTLYNKVTSLFMYKELENQEPEEGTPVTSEEVQEVDTKVELESSEEEREKTPEDLKKKKQLSR